MKITYTGNGETKTIGDVKIGTSFVGTEILAANITPEDENDPQMMEYIETSILPRLSPNSPLLQ